MRSKDDTEINPETVWKKSSEAPGVHSTLSGACAVLDLMGYVAPDDVSGGMGLLALGLYASADDPTVFSTLTGDRRAYARAIARRVQRLLHSRGRPQRPPAAVAILLGETPEELCAEGSPTGCARRARSGYDR